MNINIMNMCLSWLSIFITMWMWLLGVLPVNTKSVVILIFFVVVAMGSAASEMEKRKNG